MGVAGHRCRQCIHYYPPSATSAFCPQTFKRVGGGNQACVNGKLRRPGDVSPQETRTPDVPQRPARRRCACGAELKNPKAAVCLACKLKQQQAEKETEMVKEPNRCLDCAAPISKHATRCHSCAGKLAAAKRLGKQQEVLEQHRAEHVGVQEPPEALEAAQEQETCGDEVTSGIDTLLEQVGEAAAVAAPALNAESMIPPVVQPEITLRVSPDDLFADFEAHLILVSRDILGAGMQPGVADRIVNHLNRARELAAALKGGEAA